jgi:hypothetical protein
MNRQHLKQADVARRSLMTLLYLPQVNGFLSSKRGRKTAVRTASFHLQRNMSATPTSRSRKNKIRNQDLIAGFSTVR